MLHTHSEIKDILVLAFLGEALSIRNNNLVSQQKEVAMSILSHRNDPIARKRAYRVFILLEKAISSDYRKPFYLYARSIHQGEQYLKQNEADVMYGRKHPRLSRKLFDYLKSRVSGVRQRT